jgi:xanthine dehydrogenase accessory factor
VRRELLDLASELARRGEPFALATVVARTPPISAQVGDAALVTGDGAFHGWVGGSCTRPTVIAEAKKALADGRPRLVALDPNPESRERPGLIVFPMTCHSGGSVEIHIQPVLPPPHLIVFGVSPTARALARLGKAMGYVVSVVDPTAEPADFPGADAVVKSAQELPAGPAAAVVYAVVATQGQWDEEAVGAALGLAPAPRYLGVMASKKRFGEMRELFGGGHQADRWSQIKNPAGLDLGAELPEEIAVSILAEIVKERPRAAREERAEQPAVNAAPRRSAGLAVATRAAAPAAGEAIDPVCQMTVTIAGAAHRAQHGGREYYFCCGGCRERFVASPERYLAVGAPA